VRALFFRRHKRDAFRTGFRSTVLPLLAFSIPGTAYCQLLPEKPTPPAHLRGENGETLREKGSAITGALTYTSDLNADIAGGNQRGFAYLQRVGLLGDVDLDRLVGWSGAAVHLGVHSIAGNGLSGLRVGNILTVSGIEAEPALRLFNLWFQQQIGKRATLRVGQFTAGQEFVISNTASLFVNSTFGWPGSFASDLPSGGSAYPLAGPGVRLAVKAGETVNFKVGVFAGDPAGQGTGDPQRRDLHGFNGFRLKGAPFVIAEVRRSASGNDPAWSVTLGGWAHFDRFSDLRLDTDGQSLALPTSTGQPFSHRGDYAVYAIADARLWRSGSKELNGFLRLTASPSNRNPVDLYLDGGVSVTGLFKSRPNDVGGIGVAFARLSPSLRTLLKEQAALAGQKVDLPSYEGVIEATYQLQIRSSFSIQPNVQLVLHPSASLLNGDPGAPSSNRALVVGIRSALRL